MSDVVVVPGLAGETVTLSAEAANFGGATAFDMLNAIVASLSEAVASGELVPMIVGGSATLGPGQKYYLVDTVGGTIDVPPGTGAVILASGNPVTLRAASASGMTVLGGLGTLTYDAGAGSNTVFAGAPGSVLTVPSVGGGANDFILGADNVTVQAPSGDVTIWAAGVADKAVLGSGNTWLSGGNRFLTVVGGSGPAYLGVGNVTDELDLGTGPVTAGAGGVTNALLGPASLGAVQAVVNAGAFPVWMVGANSTINGGSGPLTITNVDTVFGSNGNAWGTGANVINGGGGLLSVTSFGGDTIRPGASDLVYVQQYMPGPPYYVYKAALPSVVEPGSGSVTITGAAVADLSSRFAGGTAGHNVITAGASADTLIGGGAGDLLSAAYAGGDRLIAAAGGATLSGLQSIGNDTLLGGSGDDLLIAGIGSDSLDGGGGHDTILAGGITATITTGAGADLIAVAGFATVTLAGSDTLVGGAYPLQVTASGAAEVFPGSGGLALVTGAASATLVSGTARVTVTGGVGGGLFGGGSNGGNLIAAGTGRATIIGGGAGDTLLAGGSVGDLIGAAAGDATVSAAASTGNNTLFGGAGNDLLIGGGGVDVIVAGAGADTVQAGTAPDLFAFLNGMAGGSAVIAGFTPGWDSLALRGYGPGVESNALGAATLAGGNTTLALPDGTHITLLGVTGLTGAAFL